MPTIVGILTLMNMINFNFHFCLARKRFYNLKPWFSPSLLVLPLIRGIYRDYSDSSRKQLLWVLTGIVSLRWFQWVPQQMLPWKKIWKRPLHLSLKVAYKNLVIYISCSFHQARLLWQWFYLLVGMTIQQALFGTRFTWCLAVKLQRYTFIIPKPSTWNDPVSHTNLLTK